MNKEPTQPAAPLQPPNTDKKIHVTGLGVVDIRAPLNGVGQDIGGNPVTGGGKGTLDGTPTGTPFAESPKESSK